MPHHPDLDALVDRVYELTPLPAIAMQVMRVAEDDRFSAYDLAAVISADQALTAKLLRLANSAYYGFSRRISTVRDAVVLLGFREVKSAATAAALVDMTADRSNVQGPFSIDLFWGHAIACAVVADVIARETGMANIEEAFTAGILHDIGLLALSAHDERLPGLVQRALGQNVRLIDLEREELGFTHADVGRRIAERWHFPPQLVDAIGLHHSIDLVADRHGLAYVVAYANLVCEQLGLWSGYDPETPPVAGAGLDITDKLFVSTLRRLGGYEALAERIRSFLDSATNSPQVRLHSSVVAVLSGEANDRFDAA